MERTRAVAPVFDPTGEKGPRDWADLYGRIQVCARVFVWTPARRVDVHARTQVFVETQQRSRKQGSCAGEHKCASECQFQYGNFTVCIDTGKVHYCDDVRRCPCRIEVDGYTVCSVTGEAVQSDQFDTFGYLIDYADATGRSRAPAREAGGSRYKRARVCTALRGATTRLPGRVREAILHGDREMFAEYTGGIGNDDDIDDGDGDADDGQARAFQLERERAATAEWFSNEYICKDVTRVVSQRMESADLRWRKVVYEHVGDCLAVGERVSMPLLIAFMAKQVNDLERWRAAYVSVPDACLPVLRAWMIARTRFLWQRFLPHMHTDGSPLKYNFHNHTLAVYYCSATGIQWPRQHDAVHADRSVWLLPPVEFLEELLPPQKELDKRVTDVTRNTTQRARAFTRAVKMTRSWLVGTTMPGHSATEDVDAPFVEQMRAFSRKKT